MMAARVVIVLALALTFYPLVKAYTLGQIQNWLNGLFALALWFWVSGRKVPSGILIALMRGAGATIGEEGELARVVATLDRGAAQQVRHARSPEAAPKSPAQMT